MSSGRARESTKTGKCQLRKSPPSLYDDLGSPWVLSLQGEVLREAILNPCGAKGKVSMGEIGQAPGSESDSQTHPWPVRSHAKKWGAVCPAYFFSSSNFRADASSLALSALTLG